jgi:hypothetical protein
LALIAEGHSYDQILAGHPALTYSDIFEAAKEALSFCASATTYQERLARIKREYPRAYEPWSENEERHLEVMYAQNLSHEEMGHKLQRQPSAIRSRLARVGLDKRNTSAD